MEINPTGTSPSPCCPQKATTQRFSIITPHSYHPSHTNDDEDHEEDLDARSEAGSEEGGVGRRSEHISIDQLPACLLQSLVLRGERGQRSMEEREVYVRG